MLRRRAYDARHPSGHERRVRVHDVDAAHAAAIVRVEIRHAQAVRGLRRQRQRRNAHDVARVVDETRKMRRDRGHLDAVRAQTVAQRVDACDDAVHDRPVALGEESDAHGTVAIRHTRPQFHLCRERRQACARAVPKEYPAGAATLVFDGSARSCYRHRVHRDPSGSGGIRPSP